MDKKILIVEDDKDLSDGYKFVFEKNEYKVAVAYDGEDGLAKVDTFKPDLILLDIVLPKMSGIEVLRQLESKGTTKTAKVVMLTGLNDEEKVGEALFAGAINYLVKSNYTFSELVIAVENILEGDK